MGVLGMDYQIVYVDTLPEGHDFVLAQSRDSVVIAYRRSAVCPQVLEDSWAAFRALQSRYRLAAVG